LILIENLIKTANLGYNNEITKKIEKIIFRIKISLILQREKEIRDNCSGRGDQGAPSNLLCAMLVGDN
jgi:hypothetical protein